MLNEPEWQNLDSIGDLVQREPLTGAPPSEATIVRLAYDTQNLYIGVACLDSDPTKIIGTHMARDANLTSDDRVQIVLDTYDDRRNAYYFATNPAGALVDGLVFANGQLNEKWDAIWTVRTRVTEEGWSAEFAIPFKSLSFPPDVQEWGFNLSRTVQRKLEESRWSSARTETQFLQISEAGRVTNLGGIAQGFGLDIRPFSSARWMDRGSNSALTGKLGLDVFYSITPSLKLSGTLNTDFGETEVDAREINLARYSVLLPEKRTFFLQDIGVFSFASAGVLAPPAGIPAAGAEVHPFFSRRIGLLAGEEIPLNIGAKLTGRVGRTDVGVLGVQTDAHALVPQRNLAVARVRQNVLEQSYVGAIFTEGDPTADRASRTYGADLSLATSRFLGAPRNFVFTAYGLRSENEDASDEDFSYGFSARYPNDKYDALIAWREIQPEFRPALGFVQRTNIRQLRIGASYNPRPKDFLGIQQMFHDIYYTRTMRAETGELESRDVYATFMDWHFRSGDALHSFFDYNATYERLFEPFQIYPGVELPQGEYRFTRWRNTWQAANKRRVSALVIWSLGEFWSGHANTFETTLTLKMPPRFVAVLSTNQTFARLPEGNFIARIFSTQLTYARTPFLTFSNVLQYDNSSRNLGAQSRVHWTMRPGTDLFIVLGKGMLQGADGGFNFRSYETRVSAKFQHTFRF